MKKKIISLGYAFIIAFSVICSSYFSAYDVQAAGLVTSIRDKLAYYVLTTTGALNAGVNGVTQATSSAIAAVQEKIADLWGNGIYEDASGNYVFSGTASKELLETIMGHTNLNARVISSFPGATPYGGMYGSDNAYYPPKCKSFLNTGRSIFTDYLCISGFNFTANDYPNPSSSAKVLFLDLTNCAYIRLSYSNNNIIFTLFNENGNTIANNYAYVNGYVDRWGNISGSTNPTRLDGGGSIEFSLTSNGMSGGAQISNNYYFTNNVITPSLDYGYNNFPFISDNQCLCWSNKSIIICTDSVYGLQEATKQTGTFVSNTYNIIPTVKKTVIENNNWQKIYNDYVQNVNNEGNTYITNETLDPSALRKVMKKYTKVITDAIDQGVDDIENAISTTNEWLKKIYERLGEISAKLDNMGGDSSGGESGGASDCPWTVEDIETITDALDRIDSNLASELTEMQRTYTLLGQILSAINNIEVDGGDSITNIIPILVNLPDADVLDFIDTGDVLADLMSSVVPFCFVGFALGLCDTLAAQPVTPRWVIPLRVNSATTGLNVNEEMVIDFADYEQSGFGFIHDLLIAAQCILFIIALIWLTFNLLESFNLIFG